ncbi:hypothetical protein E4U41_000813 [Claviceps citrina]|nr:hypothetical protein E4U41_000813 [Claviceps citrina]
MQFSVLFLAAAVAAAAAVTGRDNGDTLLLWCDHGTAGDGGCEANGLHTYCV